jgi:hypothetical protein
MSPAQSSKDVCVSHYVRLFDLKNRLYEGLYESIAACFFCPEIIIRVVMKFTSVLDKSLQSLDYFSTKSLSLSTHFFHLCVRLSGNSFCWIVGVVHARCVSARRRPQNDVLSVRPSVAKQV